MGSINSKPSVEIKNKIEKIYSSLLDSKNIHQTVNKLYRSEIETMTSNVFNGLEASDIDNISEKLLLTNRNKSHEKLSEHYVKKINLIGTIINSVKLAHLKMDIIERGNLCISKGGSNIKRKPINVEPSIPFNIEINTQPIFLNEELINIQNMAVKKTNITDPKIIEQIAFLEIDDETECKKNGGNWVRNIGAVINQTTPLDNEEYKKWSVKCSKIQNDIYIHINRLLAILDTLIDERVEPKMIDGKEVREKVFRDRIINEEHLNNAILKTKRSIIDMFIELDSYYLILASISHNSQ